MEASLLVSKAPIISRLHLHFSTTQSQPSQLTYDVRSLNQFGSVSLSRSLATSVNLRPQIRGSSVVSFASCGGKDKGKNGSGSGGGGCGSNGGAVVSSEAKATASPEEGEDVSALSSDVIIIDVGGMMCGGCSSSVKRILESQSQVSSASVNLTTETAIVWPVSEAKNEPNWQKQVGDTLANHLTTCGFTSKLRGQEANEGASS